MLKLKATTICIVIACGLAMIAGILSTIMFGLMTCNCDNDPGSKPAMIFRNQNMVESYLEERLTDIQNMFHFHPVHDLSEKSTKIVNDWNYTAIPITTSINLTAGFVEHESWKIKLAKKYMCRKRPFTAGYYLYHARKAAGTTVREILKFSGLKNRAQVYETEGITLDRRLLQMNDLITVTSLRHPIDRIVSLYWYEHVSWFAGKLRNESLCKPMNEWIDAWKDSAPYKMSIQRRFPNNNYVEIENYYVKMLIGWRATDGPITRDHLELAKKLLTHFDMVIIMEWLQQPQQRYAIEQLLPFTGSLRLPNSYKAPTLQGILESKKVAGNMSVVIRYNTTFAANEAQLRNELSVLNALDLELYDFAKALVYARVNSTQDVLSLAQSIERAKTMKRCGQGIQRQMQQFKPMIGVFQPPGHKGPL